MNIDNPKIWSLTDGSQGMISQTKGLANALSMNIKEIKTEIIFPWNRLQPGILPIFSWIFKNCLLYTSPSPRDAQLSRMPSSA